LLLRPPSAASACPSKKCSLTPAFRATRPSNGEKLAAVPCGYFFERLRAGGKGLGANVARSREGQGSFRSSPAVNILPRQGRRGPRHRRLQRGHKSRSETTPWPSTAAPNPGSQARQ
jgi:hypothetical protein